jgi:hypothetical protein
MKTQKGKLIVVMLALALGTASMQSAQAQTFKKVKVSLNAPLVQVASGGASVWALASNGHPYVLKGKSFALANTISLSQIAVGGGTLFQADEVWALNSSGSVYRASKSGASWIFSQVSGSLDLIVVGPGYQDSCHPYEVWGLNPSSQIFRYNFCGNNFDQEPGSLCNIVVGGGDIWGSDCGPDVFLFDFSAGVFGQVGARFSGFPLLTVGPNNAVLGIDTSNSELWEVYGSGWASLGLGWSQIQAGGNGVWALSSANSVYRWGPGASDFTQVPGVALVSISVGTGGGVWGINSSHQVFAFSTP